MCVVAILCMCKLPDTPKVLFGAAGRVLDTLPGPLAKVLGLAGVRHVEGGHHLCGITGKQQAVFRLAIAGGRAAAQKDSTGALGMQQPYPISAQL